MKDIDNLMSAIDDVSTVLEIAITDPNKAADIIESWIHSMQNLVDHLRTAANIEDDEGTISEGGITDKVLARVYGPDGKMKAAGGN